MYYWHLRLGHISLDRINLLIKVWPLRELSVGTLPVCEFCQEVKMTKRHFIAKGNRAKEPLEFIHEMYVDLSSETNEYFVILYDNY